MWLLILAIISANHQFLVGANIEIPFKLMNGLIVLEAELNGDVGNYILDTGSSDILINKDIQQGSVTMGNIGEEGYGEETILKKLVIGGMIHKDVHAIYTDLSTIEVYLDKTISGILGSKAFSPKSIHIDFDAHTIVITPDRLNPLDFTEYYSLKYQNVRNVPVISLHISNRKYNFIVDTGASTNFIDKSILSDYDAIYTGIHKDVVTSYSSELHAYEVNLETVKIGDKDTTDITFLSMDMDNLKSAFDKDIHGIISVSKISSEVIFDLKAHRIYYR